MEAFYGIANYFGLFFAFAVCALCVFTRFVVDTHLGVRSAYEELAALLEAHGGVPVEER